MRQERRWVLLGVVLCSLTAIAVQACGDDEAPPLDATTDGGSSTDGSSSTDGGSSTARDGDVDNTPRPSCPEACSETAASSACVGKTYKEETCLRFCPCISGAFRPNVIMGALACIAGCRDGGEDNCLAKNVEVYAEDPETKDTVTACSERQNQCRGEDAGLGTDVCALYGARPDFLAQIKACLAKPCLEARACIRATYDSAGCED